jgi:hypothetical protein
MLSYEEVLLLAHQHVKNLRPIAGWAWRLADGVRVDGGWYFDYTADRLPSNPPGAGTGFGYAPGFLVTDDGSVRTVGWAELRDVKGH